MYFEIDNSPEQNERRSQRTENDRKVAPEEECPRLILAPFCRPPHLVFDNVLVGTSCERNLEVLNPMKIVQQLTLTRWLPDGLKIELPENRLELELEPGTCCCLTVSWTPTEPTALRETIHFTNQKRVRYEVIVVLKSAMNIKSKDKPEAFRVSPGKKESPEAIQKKEFEATNNSIRRAQQEVQPSQYKKFKLSNKENMPGLREYTMDSQISWSQSSFNSVDIHFNTSDIFPNMKKKLMQQTYDKSDMNLTEEAPIPSNVLEPSNNQSSGGDFFDNKIEHAAQPRGDTKPTSPTRSITQPLKLQALAKRVILRQRREAAALCIQSHFRRYIVQSRYLNLRKHVVYIQRLWRGKLVTRQIYAEFVQKIKIITKLQAMIRGYLARKEVQMKRENLARIREKRQHWAASKIQSAYRGHVVRATSGVQDARVTALRTRWRAGALRSSQDTLEKRYDQSMEVLNNFPDMQSVIKAFKSLELLTEVSPMMYDETAPKVVLRVYDYMSMMNRSMACVDFLKSAASVLANLARYRATGPKIYSRENISSLLKYMWRFSTTELELFLILSTYLWLFAKYDAVREDLAEYLHTPVNHKMMLSIKKNVDRVERMTQNATKHKPPRPQTRARNGPSASRPSQILPILEPDYGIARLDQPRYFLDTKQAINCIFRTYKL